MATSSTDNDNPGSVDPTPRIGIIGVGGAGGNAINNMIRADLAGVNFLAANTDAQALADSLATHTLQLGAGITDGLGSGANVTVGRAAAEESVADLHKWVGQCDMLFIAAGMGGGTGTGAAPVIAEVARETGALSVGVVTLPFEFEGRQRMNTALEGMRELEQLVDTLIVIPNQNLFAVANATTTFANAFVTADGVLHDAIRGITDLIVLPGLINLDFADVKAVITKTGRAMMGTGEASGESRAIDAAEAAIANPLLDIVSIKGAQGLLINVTGGPDMTLFEIDEAANRIRGEVGGDSLIIFGSAFDPALDGKLRVSVVATGLHGPGESARPQPEPEPETKPEPEPKIEESTPPPIEPALEAVMEAVIEHASEEPDQATVPLHDPGPGPFDAVNPIPTPTVPLPENPRQDSEAVEEPNSSTSSTESPEEPTIDPEPAPAEPVEGNDETKEKGGSVLGWAGKIFRP